MDDLSQRLLDALTGSGGPRDLRVYTTLFRLRRQIWHIWEWVSPWPITLWPGVGACVYVFVFMQFGVMNLLTDTVGAPLNVLILGVSAVGVYKLFDRPQVEGRSLDLFLRSAARYWLLEPKQFDGLFQRTREPKHFRIRSLDAWSPRQ